MTERRTPPPLISRSGRTGPRSSRPRSIDQREHNARSSVHWPRRYFRSISNRPPSEATWHYNRICSCHEHVCRHTLCLLHSPKLSSVHAACEVNEKKVYSPYAFDPWRIRLAAKDTALSRRRPRVRIPYALPGKKGPAMISRRRAFLVIERVSVASLGQSVRKPAA